MQYVKVNEGQYNLNMTDQLRKHTADKDSITVKLHEKDECNKAFKEFWETIFKTKNIDTEKIRIMAPELISEYRLIDFTRDTFNTVLKKAKAFKSPGEHNLGTELFTSLPEKNKHQLFTFMKLCWEQKWVPPRWKKSVLKLINKVDSPEFTSDFRPIALLDADYKIFTGIICEELTKSIEANDILDDLQFGFRKNRTTHHALLTYISVIEDAIQFNKELHVCYLDFVKAYDTVEIPLLSKIMRPYSVHQSLIDLINTVYSGNYGTPQPSRYQHF